MKFALLIAGLAVSTNALASLPPYYDSVRRIEAVLSAEELPKKFGMGPVESILALDGLAYRVTSGSCEIQVQLEAHAPNHPAPTTYTVKSVDSSRCQ
jgi:hypothetical protein